MLDEIITITLESLERYFTEGQMEHMMNPLPDEILFVMK